MKIFARLFPLVGGANIPPSPSGAFSTVSSVSDDKEYCIVNSPTSSKVDDENDNENDETETEQRDKKSIQEKREMRQKQAAFRVGLWHGAIVGALVTGLAVKWLGFRRVVAGSSRR